jgi:hypothetical protein
VQLKKVLYLCLKLEIMSLEKVFKTPTNKIAKELTPMKQSAIIQDIILMVRKNPNHTTLGAKVDRYIKEHIK